MGTSSIEWTEITWNPTTGCDRVSDGCTHCYALTLARRLKGMETSKIARGTLDPANAKYQTDGDPCTSGPGFGIATHPNTLLMPLQHKAPARIFVNSMSDLFHAGVPDEFIARVFVIMALADQHAYQILTKRPARMRSLLGSPRWRSLLQEADSWSCGLDQPYPTERFLAVRRWIHGTGDWSGPVDPLPHVWLGVSVESQQWADIRIPALLDTPAAVRWLSCEPLLGPVDLSFWLVCGHTAATGTGVAEHWRCDHCATEFRDQADDSFTQMARTRPGLGWVVVGGEPGAGARPMNPAWARGLRDQCQAADIPYFFKQWGDWAPGGLGIGLFRPPERLVGPALDGMGHRQIMRRAGKTAAGRELDGRTWDAYPATDQLPAATATAVDLPFVATVHRPGLLEVHLGFAFEHQAEHASWSLTDDLRNTQHVEGTTVNWSPTPPAVSPLAPLPTDLHALAELIAAQDNHLPMGHAFPDLFSRLKAQEGYETAARLWHDACLWLDRDESEED